MKRVITYIDGFNLYFGIKSKGWRKYYWLDLVGLSKALLKPDQQLIETHYFTARIRATEKNQEDIKRQSTYLDTLATFTNLSIHEGHFLQKKYNCSKCKKEWISYEEKMTDVNIAAQLLVNAFDNKFDTALIVSGDSDLTTPVQQVRERFPNKKVIIAFPPDRRSHQLSQAANGSLVINADKLRQNQLPNQVITASGFILQRPDHWQ